MGRESGEFLPETTIRVAIILLDGRGKPIDHRGIARFMNVWHRHSYRRPWDCAWYMIGRGQPQTERRRCSKAKRLHRTLSRCRIGLKHSEKLMPAVRILLRGGGSVRRGSGSDRLLHRTGIFHRDPHRPGHGQGSGRRPRLRRHRGVEGPLVSRRRRHEPLPSDRRFHLDGLAHRYPPLPGTGRGCESLPTEEVLRRRVPGRRAGGRLPGNHPAGSWRRPRGERPAHYLPEQRPGSCTS